MACQPCSHLSLSQQQEISNEISDGCRLSCRCLCLCGPSSLQVCTHSSAKMNDRADKKPRRMQGANEKQLLIKQPKQFRHNWPTCLPYIGFGMFWLPCKGRCVVVIPVERSRCSSCLQLIFTPLDIPTMAVADRRVARGHRHQQRRCCNTWQAIIW